MRYFISRTRLQILSIIVPDKTFHILNNPLTTCKRLVEKKKEKKVGGGEICGDNKLQQTNKHLSIVRKKVHSFKAECKRSLPRIAEGARGVECIRVVERSYRNRCSPWKGGWSSEPRLSVLQFARQRGSLSRGFFFVTGAKDQRSQPFGFVYCPIVSFQGNKTRSVRHFRFGKLWPELIN